MNTFPRKKTHQVMVGTVPIGGNAPISVQSMTKTDTRDVAATLEQIRALETAGCDIVRVAIPDDAALAAVCVIMQEELKVPIVADIHFDWRLAMGALRAGVAKLRINPGNIGSAEHITEIACAAADKAIPIRIGVNAGSLDKKLLKQYGGPTAEALVASALGEVALFEKAAFTDIVISVKASDVAVMIAAYRLLSQKTDYPLHLGLTEAGTVLAGTVRSTVALSQLITEGIGDTLRVSLTADPVEEVRVGLILLESLGVRTQGVKVVSCPTCGRCEIDVIRLAEAVEKRLQGITAQLTVAVMGCVVNGPGEASAADFGICGGNAQGAIYAQGKLLRTVPEEKLLDTLFEEIQKHLTKTSA